MIQHGNGKRGRLSVKNKARKRTAIRGYLIRKDSEHRFCIATKPEALKAQRGAVSAAASVGASDCCRNQRSPPETRTPMTPWEGGEMP